MSREGSHNNATGEPGETLEIIREECSPAMSSVNINTPKALDNEPPEQCTECKCMEQDEKLNGSINPNEVEKLLKQKEDALTADFKHRLETEINSLKDRADFILQNEQIRASYMLREAHRERQEKISALQTQLECKNLAGLMYVMCSERRKSKLELLRINKEYTDYIRAMQEILTDAQSLILNLSRGYKTATRVDQEWRQKMKKVLGEFQAFVHNYAKGTPESDQFFFDLPTLLKTESPLVDNPNEDPCADEELVLEEEEETVKEENKPWYERLDEDCRPFVMFGDMADFKPPQRREVLRAVKGPKSAPRKWKEYVFNDMFVKSECSNVDAIKDEYSSHLPAPAHWECHLQQDINHSRTSYNSRRTTTASLDVRGNMGSILKMITSSSTKPQTKAVLLGARDSMEIASTTRLREKHKHSGPEGVVINVGTRRTSFLEQSCFIDEEEQPIPEPQVINTKDVEDDTDESLSALGSVHNDSLSIIQGHVPEKDHKIHYEKICPMEKCQRMHVESFVRSLPPYMRASPFTHFEQTYEDYEVCSPEQLDILKQRIAAKKRKEKADLDKVEEDPLSEWTTGVAGIAVQTSDLSMVALPPCSCMVPRPTPVGSTGCVFSIEGLLPVKQTLDNIKHECFYDSTIEFNRFKVVGQDSSDVMPKKNRAQEITYILKEHPSLLDIFQGNAA